MRISRLESLGHLGLRLKPQDENASRATACHGVRSAYRAGSNRSFESLELSQRRRRQQQRQHNLQLLWVQPSSVVCRSISIVRHTYT